MPKTVFEPMYEVAERSRVSVPGSQGGRSVGNLNRLPTPPIRRDHDWAKTSPPPISGGVHFVAQENDH